MGKVGTERIRIGGRDEELSLEFKIDINVGTNGVFTTMLPQNIVQLFLDANIKLDTNRLRNPGFFQDDTYVGLLKQVKDVSEEYISKELISEGLVIKYVIQTTCSYCLDIDGQIVPNGRFSWVKRDDYEWKEGTLTQNANSPRPFGLQMFAQVLYKRKYKYKSGIIKLEYERVDEEKFKGNESDLHIKWLCGMPTIIPPSQGEVQEIECNERTAKFFVEMLKSICMINERIVDFLDPESIKKIIENGQKLIG